MGGRARLRAGVRAPGPTPSGWPLHPAGNGGARLMVTGRLWRLQDSAYRSAGPFNGNGTAARPFLSLAMKLTELAAHLPRAEMTGFRDADFSAGEYDSPRVRPRALFVAIPGARADGHDYLPQAAAAGAAAL